MVEDVAIALLRLMVAQLEGADVDQELKGAGAAPWSLGAGTSMNGAQLLAEWMHPVASNSASFLVPVLE